MIDKSETIRKIWIKVANRNSRIGNSNEVPDSKKVFKSETINSKNFTRSRISGLAFENGEANILWKKELFKGGKWEKITLKEGQQIVGAICNYNVLGFLNGLAYKIISAKK